MMIGFDESSVLNMKSALVVLGKALCPLLRLVTFTGISGLTRPLASREGKLRGVIVKVGSVCV